MVATSKIPWDKLKADTLRAICRDFGANPGKRKREGMLEFLRAVETTNLDEALKLNIEDKEESSPRRPSTKRARHTEEQPAGASAAPPADRAPEGGAGRPKRKAAPAPATETPVRSRGKKVKTDTAASAAAAAPVSKAKKGAAEKKVSSGDDEAAKDQQEADEVDALADEPAENGATTSGQGAPNQTGPNDTPGGVVIESSKVETVTVHAS
ncbi:hypothetical protein BJV77DRAFT_965820 [Russula vinacea]|nr:hypothetical protein BJV77DRAFT_965820 [Russula vinacea]